MKHTTDFSRREILRLSGAAALAGLCPAIASAETYPSRPVEVLVGANPGGPSDYIARLFSKVAQGALGQPFVVNNKPGAGGVIATEALMQMPADGYGLIASGPSAITSAPILKQGLRYDPAKDFTPIAMLGGGGFVMVVKGSLKVNTVDEFVKLAKSRSEPLFQGSGGNASSGHLCGGAFGEATGVAFSHIPYQGDATAFTDLLGGQLDVMFTAPNVVAPHLGNKDIKVLAVTSTDHIDGFDQVPTLQEAGLVNFEYLGWIIMLARAGTSDERLSVLRKIWQDALGKPEIGGDIKKLGMLAPERYHDPKTLPAFIEFEQKRTALLIKKLGITG